MKHELIVEVGDSGAEMHGRTTVLMMTTTCSNSTIERLENSKENERKVGCTYARDRERDTKTIEQ